MIRTTELRIGNYLMGSNGPLRITSIFNDDLVGIGSGDPYLVSGETPCLLPILLSDEILEKCGFKIQKEGILFELLMGRLKLNLIMVNAVDSTYYIASAAGFAGMLHFPHQQYLHQLQNLFFALTGQELSVDLSGK